MTKPPRAHSERIAVIEAMRGIAALAVALYHFSRPLHSEPARWLGDYGWLGVDAFFVISGMVVPLSLFGRDYEIRQFPSFMARRLVRLEPAYLASIILSLAVWHLSVLAPGFQGEAPNYSAPQLAAHILYVVPLTSFTWLQPVYWSLAFEFVFYCLVGLLFPTLMHRRVEWTVAVAAAAVCCLVLAGGRVDLSIYPMEFLVGILLARWTTGKPGRGVLIFWLVISVAGIWVLGGAVRAVVVAVVALTILRWHDLKLGAWAYFFGAVSYSLYLTHVPVGGRVVNLARRFGEGAFSDVLIMVIAAVVSVAFAFVYAYLIERPSMRVSRRLFASRTSM